MMKKIKMIGVLLVMAFALTACATPQMVKCPECGHVFDAQEHQIDRYGH